MEMKFDSACLKRFVSSGWSNFILKVKLHLFSPRLPSIGVQLPRHHGCTRLNLTHSTRRFPRSSTTTTTSVPHSTGWKLTIWLPPLIWPDHFHGSGTSAVITPKRFGIFSSFLPCHV